MFCIGLLDAVLPAAQSNLQRFQLLYAVLERLALHQWFYQIKGLSADERRDLVVDFLTELRSSAEIDIAQALEIDWALLTDLSLRRFGLADAGNASATARATRPMEDANRCLMAKLNYRLGDDIDFSRADTQRYMQGAWGEPEPWGVWTHGPLVDLLLWPVETSLEGGLFLHVCLKPFLENVSRQTLAVSANGVDLGFLPFSSDDTKGDQPRWCAVSIPQRALASRPLRISFVLPDLPSPASLGLAADAPILGLGFLSARISRAACLIDVTYEVATR